MAGSGLLGLLAAALLAPGLAQDQCCRNVQIFTIGKSDGRVTIEPYPEEFVPFENDELVFDKDICSDAGTNPSLRAIIRNSDGDRWRFRVLINGQETQRLSIDDEDGPDEVQFSTGDAACQQHGCCFKAEITTDDVGDSGTGGSVSVEGVAQSFRANELGGTVMKQDVCLARRRGPLRITLRDHIINEDKDKGDKWQFRSGFGHRF